MKKPLPKPSLKLLSHTLLAFAAGCLMILPDHLYALAAGHGPVLFRPAVLAALTVVAFLLLALRNRFAVYGLLAFFFLLQLGQLLHMAYFGTAFAPHEIRLLFSEWDEVGESAGGVPALMLPPALIVLACYAALAMLARRFAPYRLHFPPAALPLALLLLILPLRAYTSDESQRFYPNPKTYTLDNALRAFSFFLVRDLPSHLAQPEAGHWKPYPLQRSGPPVHANIVLVMGESLTPAHMSLFGYSRETTPQLESLRADTGFIFRQGIAAGVATKVSLPMFFNIAREPGNLGQVFRQQSNLLKLAKAQGFLTRYYSTQSAGLSTFAGIEYADVARTAENMEQTLETRHDEVLLDLMRGVDLSRPNFIVLHQRNSHSPYAGNYPPAYDYYHSGAGGDANQQRVDAYDNSVRYTDHLLYRLIRDLAARSKLPVYVLFTSDHGEMLGEQGGQFGHAKLTAEVARVPFIFYARHGEAAQLEAARRLVNPTHYEMGKLIAGLLGYRVDNPNERAGAYYLNGTDLSGSEGYLPVNKAGVRWELGTAALAAAR